MLTMEDLVDPEECFGRSMESMSSGEARLIPSRLCQKILEAALSNQHSIMAISLTIECRG